jgi:hypothetical protein
MHVLWDYSVHRHYEENFNISELFEVQVKFEKSCGLQNTIIQNQYGKDEGQASGLAQSPNRRRESDGWAKTPSGIADAYSGDITPRDFFPIRDRS